MHHIYHTEGFILKSVPTGEANRLFYILTKDLGLIKATAQGVRLLKSKLRYKLQNQTLVKISVVRGKEIWRIVGVEHEESFKNAHNKGREKTSFFAKISSLVLRLSPGEEKNEQLFNTVWEIFSYLENNGEILLDECVEHIVALRILKHLGYLKNMQEFSFLGNDNIIEESRLCLARESRKLIIAEINNALQESHL